MTQKQSVASSSPVGLSLVVSGAALLGFAGVFVKWGLQGGATPITIGLYRMLFALPGIVWLTARRGFPWGPGVAWAAIAGVAFAGDLNLWHLSMKDTSAANATFIVCGLTPVWVALFSVAVHKTRYRAAGWLGQILGVCGALFLALARGARVGNGQGELLAIGASFCYSTFSLTLSRSRRHLSARHALLWMSLGSLATFAVLETVTREPLTGYSTLGWTGLVGLALVVQLFAWLIINRGMGQVNVALGTLGLSVQQIATPFLAAWLLNEELRPLGLVGGALIIGGIVLVATGEATKSQNGIAAENA